MFKRFLPVFLLAVAALTSDAANGMKTFKLNNDTFAVKAGTVITAEVEFESDPGYVLAGWAANLIRKNSAPEFFEKPEVKIRKHPKSKDYDVIDFVRYVHFPKAQTKGKFTIKINTAGMPTGDYAVAIQGRWMKDNKSTYPGATLYVSITEADNGKFAPTAQPQAPQTSAAAPKITWCKKITVTPQTAAVKSGSKVTFTCNYEALPGEFFGGFLVVALRKNTPAAFFDTADQSKIRKHKASGYDTITLLPYKHSANQAAANFTFELDTTGYPAGNYDLYLQIRRVKADKKTAYPNYVFNLTIQ